MKIVLNVVILDWLCAKPFLGSIFYKPFITEFILAQIELSSYKISGQILKHIILSKSLLQTLVSFSLAP